MTDRTRPTSELPGDPAAAVEFGRAFSGPPDAFWPACIEAMARVAGAGRGLLLVPGTTEGEPWRIAILHPSTTSGDSPPPAFLSNAGGIADTCASEGHAVQPLAGSGIRPGTFLVGVSLPVDGQQDGTCVAAFWLTNSSDAKARRSLQALRLVADTPSLYQLRRTAARAQGDLQRFASVLDLTVLLNDQTRFLAAAMTVCNELATRHHCDRVSLGWLKGHYVRLQAMSHTERFERKMAVVKDLEMTMEEAVDQDEEIVWPAPEDATFVSRDHARFAHARASGAVCSVPLRLGAESLGCITCERSSSGFAEEDLAHLRLCADQTVRRLDDLQKRDRWIGARLLSSGKDGLSKVFGIEHTLAKVGAVVVLAALGVLVFGKMDGKGQTMGRVPALGRAQGFRAGGVEGVACQGGTAQINGRRKGRF